MLNSIQLLGKIETKWRRGSRNCSIRLLFFQFPVDLLHVSHVGSDTGGKPDGAG